jgi:hypothetical protein
MGFSCVPSDDSPKLVLTRLPAVFVLKANQRRPRRCALPLHAS